MPFQKGHKLSVGNSGGKNWNERLKTAIEFAKEDIEQEVINKLSRKLVARKLSELSEEECNQMSDIQGFVNPIVLRTITEKKEVKQDVTITNELTDEIVDDIIKRYVDTTRESSSS